MDVNWKTVVREWFRYEVKSAFCMKEYEKM